ncbi:MAG: hypothetical protein AB4050_01625 [Synechococcus sp.]
MKPLPRNVNRLTRWFQHRHINALNNAFVFAQEIEALEKQYFNGAKVEYSTEQSKTLYDYISNKKDRNLFYIRVNLAQFRLGSFLPSQLEKEVTEQNAGSNLSDVADKLFYIESVIGKYRTPEDGAFAPDVETMPEINSNSAKPRQTVSGAESGNDIAIENMKEPTITEEPQPSRNRSHSMGLLKGIWQRGQAPDDYEQQFVEELRQNRKQNRIALRWLVVLVLVPLLMSFLSRNLIFEPLLGTYSERNPLEIELDEEVQEEFATNLQRYKEQLEIRELLGIAPEMTAEAKKAAISDKANELWREARETELSGFKNLLADLVALISFAGLVLFNRSRISVLRSAINRSFLTLSDPVKVFVFILITDMFVGFHSAEGWAVILSKLGDHFGLPESEAAIGIFIATVPVVIDSCIKFWLFTYLTRFSPSSSAIYERMNT